MIKINKLHYSFHDAEDILEKLKNDLEEYGKNTNGQRKLSEHQIEKEILLMLRIGKKKPNEICPRLGRLYPLVGENEFRNAISRLVDRGTLKIETNFDLKENK